MIVVRINENALERVKGSQSGMTFIVDRFDGNAAYVRDYRYGVNMTEFQIWRLEADAYEVVAR